MSERIPTFWLLILFLFPHGLFSKSATNSEYTIESGNLIAKSDADQPAAAVEENPSLHDSYRPRHKYKTDSGSQLRFYRSETEGEKELEVKIPQCAVMYKNSEPVGILQPFEDSYRFLQVSGEPTLVDINPIPVKRKTIMDVLYPSKMADEYDDQSLDNTAQFTDERYPSIFAKFKIDSRLDKSLNPDIHLKRSMHKRGSEKTGLTEVASAGLKSSLVKKSDEGIAVEDELKNILDDMGLIDDYSETKEDVKREAEDENMELGTNKISLVKDESKEKRDKREEQNSAPTLATTATTCFLSKKSISPLNTAVAAKGAQAEETHEEEEKENHVEEERSVDALHSNENSKVQEDVEAADVDVSTDKEAEEEEDLRKKRHSEEASKDSKRSAFSSTFEFTTSSLVKEAELSEYEKRVEREIRDKIEKLKNEVKKEISELKQTEAKKKESFAEDATRKKRQVNTLLDEESVDINPLVGSDDKDKIHIRRKREADFEEQSTASDNSLESKSKDTLELQKRQDQAVKDTPLVSEDGSMTDKKNEIHVRKKRDSHFGHQLRVLDVLLKSKLAEALKLRKKESQALKDASFVNDNDAVADERKDKMQIRRKRDASSSEEDMVEDASLITETNAVADEKKDKLHIRRKRDANSGEDNASLPSENNAIADEKKSFIGIDPILENDSGSGFRLRTLKQHNEDTSIKEGGSKIHVSLKRESSKDNEKKQTDAEMNERMKRQTDDGLEDDTYQDDDSEFNDDLSYDNLKSSNAQSVNENMDLNPAQIDKIDSSQFTSGSYGCKCDKNGNGCKCGGPKVDLNIPNFKQEDSNSAADSNNLLEKKSVNHCNCGKNDNHCKCGHVLDDLPSSPFKRDYQQNAVGKTSIEDTDQELQSDAQARESFPRRIKERRNANEAENLNEDLVSESNSPIKRDARARKFSAGRPFKNGEYFVDLHPDIYRLSPVDNSREKRDSFELVAMHGDSPIRKHLVAIRERSAMPHPRIRRRVLAEEEKQPRQLIDMSDEDLFGALPQSYAGELARYKRVKRTKTKK